MLKKAVSLALALAVFVTLGGLYWHAGSGAASAGATERASVDSASNQGDGFSSSYVAAVSADGRYVAFYSNAGNLVAGDTNGKTDVFVHDRQTGGTERMSVDNAGNQGDDDSSNAAISADGRYVAFESDATNLVTGDTNALSDVFVRDRVTGTTERVSVDSAGNEGDDASFNAAISSDGRFIAFESAATNLVPGDTNDTPDVFVRDRQTGSTDIVSVDNSGNQGDDASHAPSISTDGRFIAFYSYATNLVPGDANVASDVFVRDRQTATTDLVSKDSSGNQGDQDSYIAAISADDRYIAFDSLATNLVPADTNGVSDVFMRDRQTGTTERVSVESAAAQGDNASYNAAITADGRSVVFQSDATNLVAGDTNVASDVFVRDLTAPEPSPTPTGVTQKWGDFDCSGTVDPVDSLKVLKTDAGFAPTQTVANCPAWGSNVTVNGITVKWGDVDCSGSVSPVDSLKVLKTDAGIVITQTVPGCPDFGATVTLH